MRFWNLVAVFQRRAQGVHPKGPRNYPVRQKPPNRRHWPSKSGVSNGFVLCDPKPDPVIFKDWYTTPGLPQYWSCDWAAWRGTRMWIPPRSGSLPVEVEFNGPFRLPAPIEPLMYFDPEGYGDLDCFAFRCGGKYCFYDSEDHMVRRYHGPYVSPTAFLVAEFAGFYIDPPTSARLRELNQQLMELNLSDSEEWRRLSEEYYMEAWNPPWNDLYTQLFEEDEQYRIMAVDS
ncbi:hypothetical protein K438DRAFT_1758695 [Mycena galopus ATCC 62051]|nr:hypothetical protein K438DRAFT_1758695 [Mycena galopus ATCC 62051]